jgi:CubicO group peptidase (beta-lactamase class C family)
MSRMLLLVLTVCALSCTLPAQDSYFPPIDTEDWDTIDPASLNFCPDSIAALYDYLEAEQTKSFLLLKDGRIVLEQYFGTYERDSLWFWASAGKSLRATLVGIAQERGLLDIGQASSDFLGEGWTSLTPAQEAQITIWHQITMTSGLNPLQFDCTDPECLTFLAAPETFWAYHNSPYSLTKEVLEAASGQSLNQLTNQWIENRLGMQNGFWLPLGFNTIYFSRARDMARFGLMIQAGGRWEEEVVLADTAYFRQMITPSQALNPAYGYLWWLNGQESYIPPSSVLPVDGWLAPAAPEDLIVAAGAQGQFVSISRAEGLVMIRQGRSSGDDLAALDFHNQIWRRLANLSCTINRSEELPFAQLEVFPNPARDWVQLANLPVGVKEIQLMDAYGRLRTLQVKNRRLDLSTFQPGFYQLRVVHEGTTWLAKLIL